jgi:hypothetical protein
VSIVLGPVLVISGFGFYTITNVVLGRFRRMPWESIAPSTTGALVSARWLLRACSVDRGCGARSGGLLAFLYWFFFSLSMYGAREDRPRVGDSFPTFRLPASDGSLYDSNTGTRTRRLLIFYRGSWCPFCTTDGSARHRSRRRDAARPDRRRGREDGGTTIRR